MATDWGSVGAGGIQAAGQAAGALATVAGNKAAADTALAQQDISRSSSARLAKLRLAQSAEAFGNDSKQNAYQQLISAMSQQNATAGDARQLARGSTRSMEDLFAAAMLRGQ